MSSQPPSKPIALFSPVLFLPTRWAWPHPSLVNLGLAGMFATTLVLGLVLAMGPFQKHHLALVLAVSWVVCLALCVGCAWGYRQLFECKQQQRQDQALLQSLEQATQQQARQNANTSPAAVLYQLYTEHLKLGMVASLMLSQDTQSSQETLQALNKKHEELQHTCIKQQSILESLAKNCAQHIQKTKATLQTCAKGLHDHTDIQAHLQACRHQLGQFNQFAFECKQTMAVLHRHTHNAQEQTSPAVQHQQQQLLKQLEHMQEHTQHMLQHMHQAQVGLNALEKQHTELHMALQQHQEDTIRAEKAGVSLKLGHSQWEEHLKQSHQVLQKTIATLRQTEELAASLSHRMEGRQA